MKGYRKFLLAIAVILLIYFIAEFNRPKPLNWEVTLSREDKNPYGGFIFYNQLKDLFPDAQVKTFRSPVYNQVNNFKGSHTAYFLIDPSLQLSDVDVKELLRYAASGNYVVISSQSFGKTLTDTLSFNSLRRFELLPDDSTGIELVNPSLRSRAPVQFKPMTVDGYLSQFDTAHSIVLGTTRRKYANFIKMPFGKGAFYIHASPVVFSNYFLVTNNNAAYTAKALSYLPSDLNTIFWDEYYKLGPSGSTNPLRFILSNLYLRWAFRIALVTIFIFVLFEMKRKQRIIPIINPLRNSTLDFVQTVGNVYFNNRDNKNIGMKKISYFLEYLRSHLFLSTTHLDKEFKEALAKKAGLPETEVNELINLIEAINNNNDINDETLLLLNKQIDSFYEKVK